MLFEGGLLSHIRHRVDPIFQVRLALYVTKDIDRGPFVNTKVKMFPFPVRFFAFIIRRGVRWISGSEYVTDCMRHAREL